MSTTKTGTVMVTGGAGYVGSHVLRALRASGEDVVAVDTLELGNRQMVLDSPLEVVDVGDAAAIADVCDRYNVDAVVHCAAYKNVGESMHSPAKYWHNSVGATATLLDVLRQRGIGNVVFSSSCSVYGTPQVIPVTESSPIGPESVYAETKAMVERVLQWHDVVFGGRYVSLRYFNAAGASADGRIGEDWRYSLNLIPVVMKAALGVISSVDIFGDDYPTADGTCIRDYIHVEDLADAHVRAIHYLRDGGPSVALNVGTGTGSSVLDVIAMTAEISGRDVPHRVVPRRLGDPVSVYADPTKVRATLGWNPVHGLRSIISTAWNWHSAQQPAT